MRFALLTIFLFYSQHVFNQDKVITVGLQYKPIVPVDVFNTGFTQVIENNITYSVKQQFSFSGGMFIRRGLSKNWSFEGGINYVKRNFKLAVSDDNLNLPFNDNFSIIGYEIPLLALLYVRLNKLSYINAAFGTSIDFFPSNVGGLSTDIDYIAVRNGWAQSGQIQKLNE